MNLNRSNLSRAGIAGAALAILGIILFLGIYFGLGDVDQFARLMLALCLPPAIIAAILGAYILIARPGQPK